MSRSPRKNRPQPGARSGAEATLPPWNRALRWFQSRSPVIKFLTLFIGLLVLFYVLTQFPFFKQNVFPFVVQINAWISHVVLNVLGQGTTIEGSVIASDAFAVDIKRGCDALEPIAFFVIGVLTYPAPFRTKIPGILVGASALFALNIVRIVSLFLIGKVSEAAFEFIHVDVWQVLFILGAIVFWVLWIMWASRAQPSPAPSSPS